VKYLYSSLLIGVTVTAVVSGVGGSSGEEDSSSILVHDSASLDPNDTPSNPWRLESSVGLGTLVSNS
jgi:hypothetical protein